MNKKRKVLTIIALAVFSVIIALHYFDGKRVGQAGDRYYVAGIAFPFEPLIKNVRLPIFALGVFYVGLFAILGDKKRKEQ
jgi:hypothetical protein